MKSIHVEWINVTYRSVGVVVLLVILALAAGGYWYWDHTLIPKNDAQLSIDLAAGRLTVAMALETEKELATILVNAKVQLDIARVEFGDSVYGEAKIAAMRSERFSSRVISLTEGDENQERKVQFSMIEGNVRVKRAGAFSWSNADRRMVLHEGDQIKTSTNGAAKIIYFDATVTHIGPGSLLEIRDLYEDPVTKVRRVREKLTWGEVLASTEKNNVSGSYHEVTTEKVTARSGEKGEFRITHDKHDRSSTIDVFTGRVELDTATRKTTVQAGERVIADSSGKIQARQTLPGVPRLLLPSDQRVFVFEDPEKENVTLNWEDMHDVSSYRLTIADQALFTEPLYDDERKRANAIIGALAEGSYHWRVAAVSESGVIGPYSSTRRFRVSSQRIRDRTDNEPPVLNITEFVPIGQMVIINGATDPDAKLWIDNNKVEVFEDGSFNAVVKLRREGVNTLLIVAQDPSGNETSLSRNAFVEVF